ncbi:hypothetical protein V7S43_009631 [Phytophthora oleae]|uniref:Uncharacterized protein n=1 Tax=Phytophthora oleae TaxID=2107226 RepID=A0ABD3FF67_9STRA
MLANTGISEYAFKLDAVLGNLVEFVIKVTPLSTFFSWDIQDLGVLVPEWGV